MDHQSKVTEFYLLGDPDSAWIQAPKPDPFWIAINPYSPGVVYTESSSRRYLVSTEKASVTKSMGRRAPEPHPGRLVRSPMVGIKLKRNNSGLFVTVYDRRPSRPPLS